MPEVTPGTGPEQPGPSRELTPWRPTPHGAPYPVTTDLVPIPRASWERAGDEGRLPGTRRLWLAGGLAAAVTIVAVTAITLQSNRSDDPSQNRADNRTAADTTNPFLPGAPSAPAGATTAPTGKNALSSPGTKDTASQGSTAHGSASPGPSEQGSDGRSVPGTSAPSGAASPPRPASSWKSVQAVNYPDRFWHLSDGKVRLDPVGAGSSAATRRASSFKVVAGLANSSCYSFTTADGAYLRHRDFVLRADRDDGSALFRKDATFCPRASSSGAVMLEAVNYPGRFLRHRDFQLRLERSDGSGLYRADSAFRLVRGWA
ncbi:AbfB domain-containing protein [Streptomyces sp. NPDC005141]